MKLSRKSHQQLESFFREHFGDDKLRLPKIKVYSKRAASLITNALKIYGITFGRRMFIKPELIFCNANQKLCISKELLAHEVTHVLQYEKLGWIRFFYTYLKGYWSALKKKENWNFDSRREAYLEIPHEIEARKCAAEFVKWTGKMENAKCKMEN